MHGLQLNQIQDRVRRSKRPSQLMTQPIEGDELTTTVLPHNFEEHDAHKWHSSVDGRAAECILGFQGELDVLDHVCEELEVVQLAQRVQAVIQDGQRAENVHQIRQGSMRQVVGVHLDLIESRVETGVQNLLWSLIKQAHHGWNFLLVKAGDITSLPLGVVASCSSCN